MSGSVHCKNSVTLSECLKWCCSERFPWCHTALCVSAPHAVNVVHTLFRCCSSFLLNTGTQLLMLATHWEAALWSWHAYYRVMKCSYFRLTVTDMDNFLLPQLVWKRNFVTWHKSRRCNQTNWYQQHGWSSTYHTLQSTEWAQIWRTLPYPNLIFTF